MARNTEVLVPDEIENGDFDLTWDADPELKPFDLADAIKELGLDLVTVSAKDIVGETFLIVGVNQFEGSYEGKHKPFYVRCFDEKQKEGFGVVLGGQQPVQIISAYVASGNITPLRVTLAWNEGGKHGGYYTLE